MRTITISTISLLLMGPVAMAGCADNYAVEGAALGAAGGAGVAAVANGDPGTGAAVGAAAGAVAGALIKKNGRCYRIDDYGVRHRVRCR